MRRLLFSLAIILLAYPIGAQRAMTLEEAIGTARSQSVAALQAKHAFVSTYWAYRSYQASRLPSLNLYGNLMNFDRSLTLLQSYEDGTFRYANSYNLQNSLGLSVAQNVTFTGGRLSVYSDLRRIDQFGAFKNLTWYSQPITVSYYQPLLFQPDRRHEEPRGVCDQLREHPEDALRGGREAEAKYSFF